ncbi:hypothetical protein QUC31_009575 [Theobroma cacao]
MKLYKGLIESSRSAISELLSFSILKHLQRQPNGLHAFRTAKQDEAGHSPIGYLLGVLPKCYRTSSIEELHDDRFTAGSVDESLQYFDFQKITEDEKRNAAREE